MVVTEPKSTKKFDMPEMTEQNLKAALDAQMNKKDDDLKLTKEEADKFKEAFEKPEFRKLMSEYVEEISDPKNRAETDAYIKQLESQGEVPTDKEVIRPEKGYVVKFKHTKVKVAEDKKKKGEKYEKEKLFVNICSSEKVDPPKSSVVTVKGQKGRQWQIPHSLGPVRMELDKGGGNAPTLDCCYHPSTVQMSLQNPQFKDLIVETARESCVRGFKLVKDEVEIDVKYHVLKGVAYKNGDPIAMVIAKDKKGDKAKKTAEAMDKKETKKGGQVGGDSLAKLSGPKPPPAVKKGFMTAKKTTLKNKDAPAKNGGGGKRGGGVTEGGRKIPFYSLSESGSYDLSKSTMADSVGPLFSNRPGSIVYRVELPECKKAGELDLDVSDTKLVLKSLEGTKGHNYELDVALAYECEGEKGRAKWDKSKKELVVTIPVRKPSEKEIKDMEEKHKLVETVAETVEDLENLTVDEEKVVEEDDPKETSKNEKKDKKDKKKTKKDAPPVREKKVVKTKATKREAFAVDTPLPTNNSAAEFYTRGGNGDSDSEKKASPKKPQPVVETVKVSGDFTASDKFDGPRSGYVFKKDSKGVGYYVDSKTSSKKTKKSSPKSSPKKTEAATPPTTPAASSTTKPTPNPKNPDYEYRQNPTTVTLLINVPKIVFDTVDCTFTSTSISMKFSTSDSIDHVFDLPLYKEVAVEGCSYDVSSKNMIVVLKKKEVGVNWKSAVWVEEKKKVERKNKKKEEGGKKEGENRVYQNFSKETVDVLNDLD
ncbi:hypothetical protein TrVE_jg6141 [Triparma verrucosa]|uniref:PIH1 domain-containing protein 1 n=1 Tax=Triparma verrucosa TaxID=1606542 RepID=A0A9W7C598_9STRA|nr:hypothetical protein TrVE_jg6141 [Triparma verrucosa]